MRRRRRTLWIATDSGRRCLILLLAIGLLLPAELVHDPQTTVAAAGAIRPGMLSASRMLPAAQAVLRASAEAKAYAATPPSQTPTDGTGGPTDEEGGSTAGLPVTNYTVRRGDTLSGIAARFGTDVASLEASNSLTDSSLIRPGQQLVVPTQVGWVYSVAGGDTLSQIAAQVGISAEAIAAANKLDLNALLQIGQRLWIPHDPQYGGTPGSGGSGGGTSASSGGGAAASVSSGVIWPVRGPITSPFGWRILYGQRDFHDGIDIGVPMRTPVHAAISGRVILAGWDGPYGIAVEIQAGDMVTMYAHNSSLLVSVGQQVAQGQVISYSGMTGNATGPHVHFGIYINGQPENPLGYLP